MSRSKYLKDENGVNKLPHIKTDKSQLKRFVTDKERMFQKIKQLEIAEGWYMQREHIVPQEALALYISPNPREMWKATVNSLVKLANCIRDQNILVNPHAEVLSEIQKCKSRTCYIDFDIDESNKSTLEEIREKFVNFIGYTPIFLKTRGGMHVLVEPEKVSPELKNSFYKNMSVFADQTGDGMIPVPGCVQGGYVPHFIDF